MKELKKKFRNLEVHWRGIGVIMNLKAGDQLGPYRVIGPIGAVGVGTVCREQNPRLVQNLATRIVSDGFSDGFLPEAHGVLALKRNARFRVRGLLIGVLLCLTFVPHPFDGQSNGQSARPGDSRPRDITVANATGDAAEVLAQIGRAHV